MQALLTRKRSGCSASAISVEGSAFTVFRPPAQLGGAVRTVSFLLFKAAIWRYLYKRFAG